MPTMPINDKDVMVYIGPYNSGAAAVSMPILNKAGICHDFSSDDRYRADQEERRTTRTSRTFTGRLAS